MAYSIRPAQPTDNEQLLAVCALPMPGSISLSFEREPDFFIGVAVQCDQPEMYTVLNDKGQLAGCFGVGKRMVWVKGQRTMTRYFSDLRIAPDAQKTRVFFEIGKYVNAHILEPNSPAQTIIFSDNQLMIDLVSNSAARSARMHLPYYHAAGTYYSCLLALGKKYAFSAFGKYHIAPCSESDLLDLQAFYDAWAATTDFAPEIDFIEWSKRDGQFNLWIHQVYLARLDGQIKGICGVWDQKPFKQTIVHSYSPLLRALIPISNALSPLTGAIRMPRVGTAIPYAVLHCFACSDAEVYQALLVFLRNHLRSSGYSYLLSGAFAGSFEQTVLAAQPHKRSMLGSFFWVSSESELGELYRRAPGYFEIARI